MTFLITGATRGIGLELTVQLLRQNYRVIAWARSPQTSEQLTSLQRDFSENLKIQYVDLENHEDIERAAKENSSPIDALFNCAGVLVDRYVKFSDLTQEQIKKTFAVNVLAPVQVAQKLLPLLEKSSSPVLINITSYMGSMTNNSGNGTYAYRMSKTALNMFTKTFSLEFPNVKALCVHPGWVQTDMGGSEAPVTKMESASGLIKIALEHSRFPTGSFLNYKGNSIPW